MLVPRFNVVASSAGTALSHPVLSSTLAEPPRSKSMRTATLSIHHRHSRCLSDATWAVRPAMHSTTCAFAFGQCPAVLQALKEGIPLTPRCLILKISCLNAASRFTVSPQEVHERPRLLPYCKYPLPLCLAVVDPATSCLSLGAQYSRAALLPCPPSCISCLSNLSSVLCTVSCFT